MLLIPTQVTGKMGKYGLCFRRIRVMVYNGVSTCFRSLVLCEIMTNKLNSCFSYMLMLHTNIHYSDCEAFCGIFKFNLNYGGVQQCVYI